jgi:hypothetical protein
LLAADDHVRQLRRRLGPLVYVHVTAPQVGADDEGNEVGAGVEFADVAGVEFYFGRLARPIAIATVNDQAAERRDRFFQTARLDVGYEVIELLPLDEREDFRKGVKLQICHCIIPVGCRSSDREGVAE